MRFPFTIEQFLNVFKSYNESIFPLQVVFYLIAFFMIFLLFRKIKGSDRIILSCLTFFWLWIGVVYHIMYFSKINKPAYAFGSLFIIQGLLFLVFGVINNRFKFTYYNNFFNNIGLFFIIYALIIYPALGYLFGHRFPYSPTFGLPCPTTIFTFGVLLFLDSKISIPFLVIPLVWSIIGFGAALNLSIYEDYGLLIAGLSGTGLLLYHNKKMKYYLAKSVLQEYLTNFKKK